MLMKSLYKLSNLIKLHMQAKQNMKICKPVTFTLYV